MSGLAVADLEAGLEGGVTELSANLQDSSLAVQASLNREATRRAIRLCLMLGPTVLLILALFVGSIFFAVSQSLGYMPIIGKYGLTLKHYLTVFRDEEFWAAAAMSFHVAFTSTCLSTVLAILCALALRETTWGKRTITFLLQVSIPVPHIIAGSRSCCS